MRQKVNIGCSSFNNAYWKSVFYPENIPKSKWFDFYCMHFDTYEMNGTFYKPPTVKTMGNWYDKVPGDFIFSVKAPKEITHVKKMSRCEGLIEDFYTACRLGLQEKLGCILFQFPPGYQYSPDKLEDILKNLDPNVQNVLEFRHKSWWIPEVWNGLSNHNITFCSVSYPGLPDTVFTEGPLVYLRLHGKPELFYSAYSHEELTHLKDFICSSKKGKKAFVYFNNTASQAGILNALEMKALLHL